MLVVRRTHQSFCEGALKETDSIQHHRFFPSKKCREPQQSRSVACTGDCKSHLGSTALMFRCRRPRASIDRLRTTPRISFNFDAGLFQNCSINCSGIQTSAAAYCHCAPHSDVHCQLRTMVQFQTRSQNFNCPLVRRWDIFVHVPQFRVQFYSGASFAAHARESPFDWEGSCTQKAGTWARCTVLSATIQGSPAHAPLFGDGKGQTQPLKFQRPEQQGFHAKPCRSGRPMQNLVGAWSGE